MNRLIRQLDELDGRHTYGRVPPTSVAKSKKDLPTNIVFWVDGTEQVYPLDRSGAVSFLRKMAVPEDEANVNWVFDTILNTPICDAADMNGYEVCISCECTRDPGNRTLSQMGIAKSMLVRPLNRPPSMGTHNVAPIQRQEEGGILAELEATPTSPGGRLYKGEGVLLGKRTMDIYKIKKNQYMRERHESK